jgi:hypothetical protein
MVEIDNNELVFAFPEVNPTAELRIFFRRADAPEESVPLFQDAVNGCISPAALGRLVVHLRPNRYPFAVLITVAGLNALTGEPSSSLVRNPQNYFASPPQGGIDGHYVAGKVYPFRGGGESPLDRTGMEIKVFPMKSEMWSHLVHRWSLCGYYHPVISGLTLTHGGERQCEPVYEDLCCIGDWDQSCGERSTVWLKRRS